MSFQNLIMNNRTIQIKSGIIKKGPVIYWMSRDQRIHDNWALLSAMHNARENKLPVIIIFTLAENFLGAGSRQFRFMLKGLAEVYNTAAGYNIPFFLLKGEPGNTVPAFIKELSVSVLFTDFDPLKIKRKWLQDAAAGTEIPVYQTDAHNIVPAFRISQKQEFSAVHFRRKITPLLAEYLEEYPALPKQQKSGIEASIPNFESLFMEYNFPPYEAGWIKSGEANAHIMLESFLRKKIKNYVYKNDPNSNSVSDLSPYLHFGNISAQRIVLNIERMDIPSEQKESFLDELIVRRELSDNFCLYNQNYDSFEGFPQWGKETLNKHRDDDREFIYSTEQFEKAKTHDELWNAAQTEMVIKGKMHGYMRMYWGKKILEWSSSPEEALKTAIYLNDKYEIDGRDANGYSGIAWSIGGLHDRPFSERPVYGRIRYMNYNGCKRKFDVNKYIEAVRSSRFEVRSSG